MRSLSFPKISTSSTSHDDESNMATKSSPYQFPSEHSRNSSGASITSSPIASTFSTRTHTRFPSSTSSLATSPGSPVNHAKSPLDDLMEEPAERDDVPSYTASEDEFDEPLCICDEPFCEHRQINASQSATLPPADSQWAFADDISRYRDGSVTRSVKRSWSGEPLNSKSISRKSRRWPSISNRWRDRKPTNSVSNQTVRSAPPSRASSVRSTTATQSLAGYLDSVVTEEQQSDEQADAYLPSPARQSNSFELPRREYTDDPIDRDELCRTPLLPPLLSEMKDRQEETAQSPLQSPTVASKSSKTSLAEVHAPAPISPSMPTPPLSAKPSFSSIGVARSSHIVNAHSDTLSMDSRADQDIWADKLGHSNFEIEPKPYFPETCNRETCNRLLQDWENARVEFMRVAARVSEHHGPSSKIYRLTEEKWAGIDDLWRSNLELANAKAKANGETPAQQTLAETQPMSKMPSLADPEQPSKFPTIDEADIVGPMVQYAKVQRTPSKKANFLRIFTDPSSMFGRSASGARR